MKLPQFLLHLLVILGCILVESGQLQAVVITKQGVSWDTDWLPTVATLIHSPVSDPTAAGSPVFLFGAGWNPENWSPSVHRTVGQLLVDQVRTPNYIRSGSTPASVNLGPGVGTGDYGSLYSEIQLGWGQDAGGYYRGFQNKSGSDLAIYENGYPPEFDDQGFLRGGSEVSLVSLGYLSGSDGNWTLEWTRYRYTKPSGYESEAKWTDNNGNPNDGNFGETPSWGSGPTYLTLIDVSDFGLDENTWVVGVRIRNAVWFRDWATSSDGDGWVELNKDYGAGLFPFKDEGGRIVDYYLHPKYGTAEFRFDPDITVVVPLSGVGSSPLRHTPEPAVGVLFLSGLASFFGFSRFSPFRRVFVCF